jgi:hypothetical protein
MADARAMLFSRDPHLAAVGLYWMPLPTVGQLPFMLFLSPLHHAELSGPLACAFVGAITVLVIARICWLLELSKPMSIAYTLVYAFNPIVVYTNGNGMSEAWLFLTCAVTMLGFLRWSRHHRTIDLALLAAGLAGVALVRYEGLILAPIIAILAALNDGRDPPTLASWRQCLADCRQKFRRWLTTATIVAVPTYFVLALWMFLQYVLVRDPLYWYKLQKKTGHTLPADYPNLPAHSALAIGGYIMQMILAIVPALIVIGPLLLLRRRYRDILTGLGILTGALVWPLIVVIGLVLNESAGAPRYFEPATLFVAIGAIWLAAGDQPRRPNVQRLMPILLAGVLVVGAIGGTVGLESHSRTYIEAENQFFSRVLGHHVAPLPPTALSQAPIWKALAADLDVKLAQGHRVLIDVSAANRAYVFTRYPDRYIVNSDRDYLRILADPAGKFEFMILPISHRADLGDIGSNYLQLNAIRANTTGGHWLKWREYFAAAVYQFIPDLAGPS